MCSIYTPYIYIVGNAGGLSASRLWLQAAGGHWDADRNRFSFIINMK